MKTVIPDVPTSLRVFFIVHFAIDIVFAIPLFLFPTDFLEYFGWALVDPVASRIAAAALFGIGVESLIGSRASNESFVSLTPQSQDCVVLGSRSRHSHFDSRNELGRAGFTLGDAGNFFRFQRRMDLLANKVDLVVGC